MLFRTSLVVVSGDRRGDDNILQYTRAVVCRKLSLFFSRLFFIFYFFVPHIGALICYEATFRQLFFFFLVGAVWSVESVGDDRLLLFTSSCHIICAVQFSPLRSMRWLSYTNLAY